MQAELSNFWSTVERCKNPLICFRENWEGSGLPAGGDAIASALALSDTLKKLGKNPEITSHGFEQTPQLTFLDVENTIKPSIEGLRKFVITLDVLKNKVNDFSYDVTDGKLNIYLTPKQGLFDDAALTTRHENFKYDLIITLDTPSLAGLGELYTAHADLFSAVPVINIDHDPSNEFYGHINIVDITASSTAEICAELLKNKNVQINADLATKILAGLIAKTKSFKNPNLSPKTLQLASRLVELGARRDEIIQNFYRTRSVDTLKLWGRALARLKSVPEQKLVWTLLGREDFMHAGASNDAELSDVIHELIMYCPNANIVALLYEQADRNICALIATTHGQDAREVCKIFSAEGNRGMVKFCLTGMNVVEAEKYVIERLKERLKQ